MFMDSILCTQPGSVYACAVQLQASQEQCESVESKRASLANALHKLEAFQHNILKTLQVSDQVTHFVALLMHCHLWVNSNVICCKSALLCADA